jgi:hypothetical protein
MFARSIVLALVAILPAVLTPQGTPTVRVGRTSPASPGSGEPLAESWIAVNPKNPRNIVVSAVAKGGQETQVYATMDGGRTWARGRFAAGGENLEKGGDAVVYFDESGIAYVCTIDGEGAVVARSTDGGRTWKAGVRTLEMRGLDRQYMAFDRTGSFKGRGYLAGVYNTRTGSGSAIGTMGVAATMDRGRSFAAARPFQTGTEDQAHIAARIHVTREGTVVLPFHAMIRDEATREIRDWVRVSYSTDGGKTFGISPRGPEIPFSNKNPLGRAVGGAPASALDVSGGPHSGRLYFASADANEDRSNIAVMYTDDYGATWSEPVSVNDAPGNHGNPSIAVNRDGVVGIIWNDRRNHPGSSCYDLRFSASLDGGTTWLPSVTSGQKSTCPMAPGNWQVTMWPVEPLARDWDPSYAKDDSLRGVYFQYPGIIWMGAHFSNGGDTQGLDVDTSGVFHAGWVDGSSGMMQIAHTPFTVSGTTRVIARAASDESAPAPDISSRVKLLADGCKFDLNAKNMRCTFRLVNRSADPVTGPLAIRLAYFRFPFPGARVEGADNAKDSVGAEWKMVIPGGRQLLRPNETTAARTITIRFDEVPKEAMEPSILFRVIRIRQ